MQIILPSHITRTHHRSNLSKSIDITYNNEQITNNIRITNIVSFNGTSFLKRFPHYNQIKSLIEFDCISRYSSSLEQSNCNIFRGNY